jgi:hypothetical protein
LALHICTVVADGAGQDGCRPDAALVSCSPATVASFQGGSLAGSELGWLASAARALVQ